MRHFYFNPYPRSPQFGEHNPDERPPTLAELTCNRDGCDELSGPDRAYCSATCCEADF